MSLLFFQELPVFQAWGAHHIHFDFILKMLSEADICILYMKALGQGLLDLVHGVSGPMRAPFPHTMSPPKC